jgi:dihydropteroate synthase
MAVINVTPDSFSDGGKYYTVDKALEQALKCIADGADILDIGGQSTRPNAPEITAEEEIERVVPVIKAIRASNSTVAISIDTFRASVARAAITAGADIINDVSGGTRDPKMLMTMAELKCPVVLMHMRGDAATMTKLTDYKGDVIKAVREDLEKLVISAMKAGVYRWNIIVDPGIGFAKTAEQSYELLTNLKLITSGDLNGIPMLVGPSRKSFIGGVIDKPAEDRVWGTAAAVCVCVQGGAHIVRIHDVKEMVDVVKVADKCYRR